MSESPYTPSGSINMNSPEPARDKLRRVAKYQRLVIFALLANILNNILAVAAGGQPLAVQIVIIALALGIVAFTMVSIYLMTAELINAGIGVLFAIAMIIPCISLIVLLVINQRATTLLQSNGVKVGLFGANPDNI